MYKKSIIRREKLEEYYGDRVPLTNDYLKFSELNGLVMTNELPLILPVRPRHDVYNISSRTKIGVIRFEERLGVNYGSGYYTLVPKTLIEEIECKTIMEIAEPILNNMMPGHWCYVDGYLCLHYPQINITNSIGDHYTVYDMVVGIKVDQSSINTTLYGWKYTYTSEELNESLNFIHPHLEKGRSRRMLSFCLGGNSSLQKWLQANHNNLDEEKFILFLYQLKDYLEWESLEGKPYYSIGNFNSVQDWWPSISNEIDQFAKILLNYLTPDMISNGYLNAGLVTDKLLALEQLLISSGKLSDTMIGDFHEPTNRFVRLVTSTETLEVEIPRPENSIINSVREKLNIQERILSNPSRNLPNTTKRVYSHLFIEAISKVNQLLKTSSIL